MSRTDRLSWRAGEIKAQVNRKCSKNPCNIVDGEERQPPGKEIRRSSRMVPKAEKKNRRSPFWWMVIKGRVDCGMFDWSM
jgi:hypothetical protein